ncbi:hypothetical protein AUC31_02085 [Planococcus rifietoensis]|uniref:DUF4304 domain-containing protein n=1 Tax=Planococcus rifietoensis TaxID=200991 RepID=A0A0U2ZAF6_9BACL|nr:DUF4304 domain-containing protein [Planococcus rifietoensis]ALS74117.1 hypothetical protein AUC31_02085 [Planococcus rifietoensis]
MIGSSEINKMIRKKLTPVLKGSGFTKVNTRHNFSWLDDCIWVLDITAVGKYFSDVTGWPAMSIHVNLGIYYNFIPSIDDSIEVEENGKFSPKSHQCHLQLELLSTLDQDRYISSLSNAAEQKRKDLWWIEPDGSNLEEVIENVRQSFLTEGIDWLIKNTDIAQAFREIEKEHNCLDKYFKAQHMAAYLNLNSKFAGYEDLYAREKKRLHGNLNS